MEPCVRLASPRYCAQSLSITLQRWSKGCPWSCSKAQFKPRQDVFILSLQMGSTEIVLWYTQKEHLKTRLQWLQPFQSLPSYEVVQNVLNPMVQQQQSVQGVTHGVRTEPTVWCHAETERAYGNFNARNSTKQHWKPLLPIHLTAVTWCFTHGNAGLPRRK